jgi:hypothetical protein
MDTMNRPRGRLHKYSTTKVERIVNVKLIVAICAALTLLCGCAMATPYDSVLASAYSANYTEDYIPNFSIETIDGKDTGAQGVQVKPFSKGGTGGSECCSYIPGVGRKIRVIWQIGGYDDSEAQWKTYEKEVTSTGHTSGSPDAFNVLIVRFFPGHQIEAEFVAKSGAAGGTQNSRVDQLFYGRRVMRHVGD